MNLYRPSFLLSLFILIGFFAFAQDSTTALQWKVSSHKTGKGQYEVRFSVNNTNGWQLYAPNQRLSDIATTELQFPDSSIQLVSAIKDSGNSKTVRSSIFEGTSVKIYEGPTTWKQVIQIEGTVPVTLQGALLYTYGKSDEFYPLLSGQLPDQ